MNEDVKRAMHTHKISLRELAPYLHRHYSTLSRQLKKPLTYTQREMWLEAIAEALKDREG